MKHDFSREVIITLSSMAGAFLIYHLLFYLLSRWTRTKQRYIPTILRETMYYPGLFLMIVISLWLTIELLRDSLSPIAERHLKHTILILWICACAFLVARLVALAGKITLRKFVTQEKHDYSHRKALTKFELIQRIMHVLLLVATLSLVLMTFKSVRQVGSTLLASAGVLGLIIGFAAQKSLGALFAGIQIAISQPIRMLLRKNSASLARSPSRTWW
jgi:hypothetical protein